MPFAYQIKLDLYSDWIRLLKKELKQYGYRPKDDEKPHRIAIQYFGLHRRLIAPVPRNVFVSKEFSCPSELRESLDLVIDKIKVGGSLTPHMSKAILNLEFNDDLLNDWDIHHLHLGTSIDSSGFIDRTGPVLFVRFSSGSAYLINVMEHGCWAQQELVKILHRNWPDSISQFRLKEVEGLGRQLSDEDIKKLRKVHGVTFIEVEKGIVYAPLGMGYVSSGHSLEAVRTADYCANKLRLYEKYVKENVSLLVKELQEQGVDVGNRLFFCLEIRSNTVYIFEAGSQVSIKLGPLFDR